MAKSVCMNIIEEMESYILKMAFNPHSLAPAFGARFSVAVYGDVATIAHGAINGQSALDIMSH